MRRNALRDKIFEAARAVLPIAAVVTALCFTVSPVRTDLFLSFAVGAVMLVFGLGFFTMGAEHAMTRMGALMGARLTRSRRTPLILGLSFVIGVLITVAEPDLQVLAGNVPNIDSFVLILTVSLGVGLYLTVCMWRILRGVPLKYVLLASYALVFALALFEDPNYLSVAFDAGGVTTGPMTSPLIMALGVGVASIRSDRNAEADSFGLLGVCSVGPVLAVLLLGFFYGGEAGVISAAEIGASADTVEMGLGYLRAVPRYLWECFLSVAPILAFFLLFDLAALRLKKRALFKLLAGVTLTYAGLVLFLTGANVGFSSLGLILGRGLAGGAGWPVVTAVAAVLGWFIVEAEPAVHILTLQVEEISNGAVSARTMKLALNVAVALAAALSMVRAVFGIHILWFLLPGYAAALGISFFVPQIFTAVAFDAGGVASGPMTTTFLLPLAMGVCQAAGGDLLTDAFGIVALIAMMPLLTVQTVGLLSERKRRRAPVRPREAYGDNEIIELWEVAE